MSTNIICHRDMKDFDGPTLIESLKAESHCRDNENDNDAKRIHSIS